jgi:di/tricarboxylate transporter
MALCVASPANLLALRSLRARWGSALTLVRWMAFGVPVALVLVLIEWAFLCWRFPTTASIVPRVNAADRPPMRARHAFAIGVSARTIALWALEPAVPAVLGSIGITALLPVVAFFGGGVLRQSDFHALRWPLLALMGGGLAIGHAMDASELLDVVARAAQEALAALPLWPLLFATMVVVGACASVMNSTVAAAVVFPIVGVVGNTHAHADMFTCLAALMVAEAQLFPMSTFANAIVAGVCTHVRGAPERVTDQRVLEPRDFPVNAWPITLIVAPLVVSSVGFLVCDAGKL